MIPDPIHPAVVHFPMALMVLLPLTAVAALVLIRRGWEPRTAWAPVVVMSLLLAGSAWVAVQTGEEEEEVVEEVVAESAIHEHEEAAELFLPLSFAMLLLTAGGLARGRPGGAARSIASVAAVFLLVAGFRVGHTGGELVYEHGAASAYSANRLDAPRDGRDRAAAENDEREARHGDRSR